MSVTKVTSKLRHIKTDDIETFCREKCAELGIDIKSFYPSWQVFFFDKVNEYYLNNQYLLHDNKIYEVLSIKQEPYIFPSECKVNGDTIEITMYEKTDDINILGVHDVLKYWMKQSAQPD